MGSKIKTPYTLYSRRMDARPPRKDAQTRAAIAYRFKNLCAMAGMKVPDVAQALQVTERTVYAWFSGKTAVPYSAYRLLRILNRFELPGRGWDGWHMHSGKLWTPEGLGIDPHEGAWWSLLVRQARCFSALYARAGDLERALMALGAKGLASVHSEACARARREEPGPEASAEGRREAPAPNLLKKHITTEGVEKVPSTEGKRLCWPVVSFVAKIPHYGKGRFYG